MNTAYYIGTATEYRAGDSVKENDFYESAELAKHAAQNKATDAGALFGMVYEISHEVTAETTPPTRVPSTILRFVDWSI